MTITWRSLQQVGTKDAAADVVDELVAAAKKHGLLQLAVRHSSGAHVEIVLSPQAVSRGTAAHDHPGEDQDHTRAKFDVPIEELIDDSSRRSYSSNYENPALWPGGVVPTLEDLDDEPPAAPKLKGEKESE